MNFFTQPNFMNFDYQKDMLNNPQFKQLSSVFAAMMDQYQKMYKMSEEATKKSMETFDQQMKEAAGKSEKISEMFKVIEENNKKIQKFLEDGIKNGFDQKFFDESMKNMKNGYESVFSSYFEQMEKNTNYLTEMFFQKNVNDSLNVFKKSSESITNYVEEQISMMMNFQKEMLKSFSNKEKMKDIPSTVAKFSKEVAESNQKNFADNVKSVVEANNKVVAENIKTIVDVASKTVEAVQKQAKK